MQPRIVSHEEWLTARKALLSKEKEATRARDALNLERRQLPIVRIEKDGRYPGLSVISPNATRLL